MLAFRIEPPTVMPDRAADILEMRHFLADHGPTTGSQALRLLRVAFPQTSLAARVEAVSQHAHD